jgi:CRISPR-associated protein Cmr4
MTAAAELLLYLYAESPVHAGAADAEGMLDLPIQREASTRYPVIWGQSLKGALRQAAEDGWPDPLVRQVFGPRVDATGTGLEAGRLVVGDAQLVAMPVATLQRSFAWVTTGPALARLARKYSRLPGTAPAAEVPVCADDGAMAPEVPGSPWSGAVVLGPAVVTMSPGSAPLATWAKRIAADALGAEPGLQPFARKLESDLLLVGDDVAGPLLEECTEQAVRVQLDKHKTVKNGPFHTEYLPAESVLAASLSVLPASQDDAVPVADVVQRVVALLDGSLLQVGGDETIGKGLTWARVLPGPVRT